ncbi:hypothetical protein SKAU_G00017720 [Synaphobranchus kaupii]|uniref:Uncharacterized protein n=1 Tax=Synaphobranchus kaupii TaxID=118154 RepID=A0A9Q1GCI1_SYNKA|nr:hypothetical protein SKAU_G00017720 [Synaphobranchus kaupii]
MGGGFVLERAGQTRSLITGPGWAAACGAASAVKSRVTSVSAPALPSRAPPLSAGAARRRLVLKPSRRLPRRRFFLSLFGYRLSGRRRYSPKQSHRSKHQHKGPKVGAFPRGPVRPPARGPSARLRGPELPPPRPGTRGAGGTPAGWAPRRAGGGAETAPAWEAGGPRKPDGPVSQIPRAVAGSSSSLPARGSPSRSLSSDSERGPRSELSHPLPLQASSFAGRLGQPPRGPPLPAHVQPKERLPAALAPHCRTAGPRPAGRLRPRPSVPSGSPGDN